MSSKITTSKTKTIFSEDEQYLLDSGGIVIGVDEVGRGCLAGPMSVAACAFSKASLKALRKDEKLVVRDSKTMTKNQKDYAQKKIRKHVLASKVVDVSPQTIDSVGLQDANIQVCRDAILALVAELPARFSLTIMVDAVHGLRNPISEAQWVMTQKADSTFFSVAAASILAKTHRDSLMARASKNFPEYGWERNVGHGTKEHRDAISQYGYTKEHRKTFLKNVQCVQIRKPL